MWICVWNSNECAKEKWAWTNIKSVWSTILCRRQKEAKRNETKKEKSSHNKTNWKNWNETRVFTIDWNKSRKIFMRISRCNEKKRNETKKKNNNTMKCIVDREKQTHTCSHFVWNVLSLSSLKWKIAIVQRVQCVQVRWKMKLSEMVK